MPEVDDTLELQAGSSVVPGRAADDALLALLASMACSDGEVHNTELDFLVKVRRDLSRDEVRSWAEAHAGPIDVEEVAQRISDPDDRWKTLRFAARMAWKDGELAGEERSLLENLASAMALPGNAVDRVLREMSPDDAQRFSPDRVLKTLMECHWDAVQLASGQLVSQDLTSVMPPDNEVVARIGLERVEVAALCTGGIVARFQEGATFVRWSELVTYTRDFGLGSSVKLHTEDGRTFSFVDQRMSGLCIFLDRLLDLASGERPRGEAPKVDQMRGE